TGVVIISLIAADEEPRVTNFLLCFLRVAPVPVKYVGTAYFNGTDLAGRKFCTGLGFSDNNFDAGQWEAHTAGTALTAIGVGGVHPRFGHAVAFQDVVPGALGERGMIRGQQRCRTRD